MKALIFNSGLGSRMGKLTENKPKCLLEINNETVFSRQLRLLSEYGITEAVVTTGAYEQELAEECRKIPSIHVTFVNNPLYASVNYIYSMYLAADELDDDIIMMHGDLVFSGELLQKLISDSRSSSLCLINRNDALPEKDFKGRIKNGRLTEVSVNIFDSDCFALQPLYRLSRHDIRVWLDEVKKFILQGRTGVYAENAFNEVSGSMHIEELSYDGFFISEIDTPEDYKRVLTANTLND